MISVSILGKKDDYKDSINEINKTNASFLHLDIMDKTFTSNTSFSYNDSKEISKLNKKKLDIHIMSKDLDNLLDDYINLNPYIISIHYEIDKDLKKYLKKIKENNIKASIAIKPDTKVSEIYKYFEDIDQVLVLGVNPGESGGVFQEKIIDKLKILNNYKNEYKFLIEVDGGVNDKTIKLVKDYADIIVSGNFITKSDNYQKQIDILQE